MSNVFSQPLEAGKISKFNGLNRGVCVGGRCLKSIPTNMASPVPAAPISKIGTRASKKPGQQKTTQVFNSAKSATLLGICRNRVRCILVKKQ